MLMSGLKCWQIIYVLTCHILDNDFVLKTNNLSIGISNNSQMYKNIVDMAHIQAPVNAQSTIAARLPFGRCRRYALRGQMLANTYTDNFATIDRNRAKGSGMT